MLRAKNVDEIKESQQTINSFALRSLANQYESEIKRQKRTDGKKLMKD